MAANFTSIYNAVVGNSLDDNAAIYIAEGIAVSNIFHFLNQSLFMLILHI